MQCSAYLGGGGSQASVKLTLISVFYSIQNSPALHNLLTKFRLNHITANSDIISTIFFFFKSRKASISECDWIFTAFHVPQEQVLSFTDIKTQQMKSRENCRQLIPPFSLSLALKKWISLSLCSHRMEWLLSHYPLSTMNQRQTSKERSDSKSVVGIIKSVHSTFSLHSLPCGCL